MLKPNRIFKNVQTGLPVFIFLAAFIFSGCQTANHDHQAIVKLTKDLEETNKKIDEIYHRISVVQFMADNHERTLTNLKKTDHSEKTDSAVTADAIVSKVKTETAAASKSDEKKAEDEKKVETDKPPVTSNDVEPDKSTDHASGKTEEKMSDKHAEKADEKKTDKHPVVSDNEKKADDIKNVKTPVPPAKDSKQSSFDNESPEYIYNQGFAALKSKNYTRAESLFKTVVTKHPKHALAVNSLYWTGEIYYSQNNYREAINTFTKLIETYPDGSKVPDALLKIGYSYHSLKDKGNAVKYLKKVMVDHPFSSSAAKAEAMLGKIE